MTERFKPSFTVAAVIERDGRYLLVEELTSEGLLLNNPAGHLEQGESAVEGVCREVLEETARPFTPTAWLGVYMSRFLRPTRGQDVTYVRIAFVGDVGEQIPGQAFDEPVQRTLWMTLDEIRACRERHRSPLVLQCIEDHASGRRLPMEALHTHPSLYNPPEHR
ncbi:NUDIX domain-containing protein [Roseateles depolymerans]|uniref:NUDIX hydrolase n=1 Tax=Roseateles depolymerans TaxID=76731 RepID=A0A0U3CKH0_9BURK|nr:NUDIX hydrolase [Roseateles depolymerans]ALV09096.1 NUDIX hydrolase [Roseateles depolymerans]REG13851.1 ADP-ribose pyrophosphatase YjhB (NUDIX family) [Roseateles depolymerans]